MLGAPPLPALPGAGVAFALAVRAGPPHLRLPDDVAAAIWRCSISPEQPSTCFSDGELRHVVGKKAFIRLSWLKARTHCGFKPDDVDNTTLDGLGLVVDV